MKDRKKELSPKIIIDILPDCKGEILVIHCTKVLLEKLKINEVQLIDELPELSWHCHLTKYGRDYMVTLIHDTTRMALFLYGVKAKDLKTLDVWIKMSIASVLGEYGIPQSTLDNFMNEQGEITYAKTSNRSMVARMTRLIRDTENFMVDFIDASRVLQIDLSIRMNDTLVRGMDGQYTVASEELESLFHYSDPLESNNHKVQDLAAMGAWKAIPEIYRNRLEDNVYCSKCGVTTIEGYTVTMKGQDLLLEGKCNKCQGRVARLIELDE